MQRLEGKNEQAKSDHPSHSLQVTSALGTGKGFASSPPLSSFPRSCQLQLRSSGFCKNLYQKQCGLYSRSISSLKMVFLR
jgi:hypothetical protein